MRIDGSARTILRAGELEANAVFARHARMLYRLVDEAAGNANGIHGSAVLMFHRGHTGFADFAAAMEERPHWRSSLCCASLFRRVDTAEMLVGMAGESARKAAGVLRSWPANGELAVVLLMAGRAIVRGVPQLNPDALLVPHGG